MYPITFFSQVASPDSGMKKSYQPSESLRAWFEKRFAYTPFSRGTNSMRFPPFLYNLTMGLVSTRRPAFSSGLIENSHVDEIRQIPMSVP